MERQTVSTPEKSPARQTENDEPLPKVNWHLSHILFFKNLVFLTI
jgi:hypothetical protein